MDVTGCLRRVRTLVGDSGGSFVNLAEGVDLINDAQLEINIEAKVIEATHPFNTVDGTFSYVLPATFITAKRVSLTGVGYLIPISRNEVIRNSPQVGLPTVKGSPTHYSVDGVNLKLFPTPFEAVAGVVEYVRTPVEVTTAGGGTDVLTLPTYLQPLVPRMVYALYKERDEDFEAAASIKAQILMEVGIRVAMAQSSQEESYPAVQEVDRDFYWIHQ